MGVFWEDVLQYFVVYFVVVVVYGEVQFVVGKYLMYRCYVFWKRLFFFLQVGFEFVQVVLQLWGVLFVFGFVEVVSQCFLFVCDINQQGFKESEFGKVSVDGKGIGMFFGVSQ